MANSDLMIIMGEMSKNVMHLRVNFLQGAEESQKWWTTKVCDRTQASKQTPVRHFLEMALTYILRKKKNV